MLKALVIGSATATVRHPSMRGWKLLVVQPLAAAKKVLDGMHVPYTEEEVLAIRLTDRPGALGKATRKLAEKGVNILYAYGSIVKGEERALVIFGVSDVKKAAEILKGSMQ